MYFPVFTFVIFSFPQTSMSVKDQYSRVTAMQFVEMLLVHIAVHADQVMKEVEQIAKK